MNSRTFHGITVLVLAGALASCVDDRSPLGPETHRTPQASVTAAAALVVTNTDDDGPGSLRQAIADAQNNDVIHFDASLAGQTITLETALLIVEDKTLTIVGPAAVGVTLSGGDQTLIFRVQGGLVLRNLTITGGRATIAGGIYVPGGRLTVEHSTITGNTSVPVPTSGITGHGGGIHANDGATVTITNSTVSGNEAGAHGGGLFIHNSTLTLLHGTIADNRAGGTGGGLWSTSQATLNVRNSIISGNNLGNGDNCDIATPSAPITAEGVLANDHSCSPLSPVVGDALLAPLANNGGPTHTHALLWDSPAIDAAVGASVATDQRYVARPRGHAHDIGAFELSVFPPVTIALDAGGTVHPGTGVAYISGTLTCAVPATLTLRVSLAQQQKGRVKSTIEASDLVTVNCVGSKAWSIALTPATGGFDNSTATVSAETLPVPPETPWLDPVAAARNVKMSWARK
jgi:hypothetical protein